MVVLVCGKVKQVRERERTSERERKDEKREGELLEIRIHTHR